MSISSELFQIASQLEKYSDYKTPELEALTEAAEKVGKSWSRSWLESESNHYNKDFEPTSEVYGEEPQNTNYGVYGSGPPPANWTTYNFDHVAEHINEEAGNPSIDRLVNDGKQAETTFRKTKPGALSLVYDRFNTESDTFLQGWVDKVESLEILTEEYFIECQRVSSQKTSKNRVTNEYNDPISFKVGKNKSILSGFGNLDSQPTGRENSIEESEKTPPHIAVLAQTLAIKHSFDSCKALNELILELAYHLENIEKTLLRQGEIGTNVFIGHGRSQDWRELKDFISDILKLPCDEFNRVPTAGLTIPERLNQMLDQACIAFLVMTAEDEQIDGKLHPRMNVIHEVGLFQGKLGLKKAIVLLEEGCEKFSNIHGLVEIRFPKGGIRATFEEIRQVLKREGIRGILE